MPKCRINLYDICHTLELGRIRGIQNSSAKTCESNKRAFSNLDLRTFEEDRNVNSQRHK